MLRVITTLSLCFFLLLTVDAQEDKRQIFDLSGYVKDVRAGYLNTYANADLVTDNFIHNRLNARWYIHPKLTLAVEARTRFFYGEFVKFNPNYAQAVDYNDYFDLSVIWMDENAFVGHTVLDRTYLEFASGKWEIRAGRQRINWGITTVWNPNDIFNAFNFFDWDYEERPGSDAVRIQYYTGFASRIELAVKAGETLDDAVIAALWKFNKWNYDVQVLGGIARGDATLGLGWAGYIADFGFKGEATYFHPYADPLDDGGQLTATFGLDYSLSNGLYLQVGGLYNSEGALRYDGTNLLNFEVSAKNLSPFMYSALLQGAYTISPLVNANLAVIYSPGPHATVLVPGVTISLRENLDLDALGQIFLVESDGYRSLGNVGFVRLKWSF